MRVALFQRSERGRTPLFLNWLVVAGLDHLVPERIHRTNPRVVKKPVSKFRSKKPQHFGTGQRIDALNFRILTTALTLN